MEKYDSIQEHIRLAELQRSVYLAELIAEGSHSAWNGLKRAADALLSVSRAKTRNNVFTFDA
ncbi:MAG: hypothetical protein AB7P08_01095 [Burkholderiales bacterium]